MRDKKNYKKNIVMELSHSFFILGLIHSQNEILNSLPVPSSRHFPLRSTTTFKVKKVLTYRFSYYTYLYIPLWKSSAIVLFLIVSEKLHFERHARDGITSITECVNIKLTCIKPTTEVDILTINTKPHIINFFYIL